MVVLAGFIAALLSIDIVADLFKQRASLEQSYDLGAQGRFARYALGAILALDKPFGIGPLQFSKYFPEDTHNSFLNAFMSGGWLAGACYPALVALTLVFGFRAVFVRTPWQQTTIAVFAALFRRRDRKLHHRHRPLAPHVPADGRDVGADRGNAPLHRARRGAGRATRRPAVRRRRPALARPGGASYTFPRRSVAQPG